MNRDQALTLAMMGMFCLILLISGVTMISVDVASVNVSNDTSVSKVFVWNTEPNVTLTWVSPSLVELTSGNFTQVNCTAYVWDYNGWQDVRFVNATFFHDSVNSDSPDDLNNHYHNSTGNCTQSAGGADATNATCVATFDVFYNANPGNWTCNITVGDSGGNATERFHYLNDSGNASTIVGSLLAIGVPNEIDFGNLSVTEQSDYIQANVTNFGNIPINVSVRGWGGTDSFDPQYNSTSMICDFGNISIESVRWNTTNLTPYDDMNYLNSTFVGIPDFDLPVRQDEDNLGNSTNSTYWKIQIPFTVGGYCNGTVQFSATETV